MTCKSTENVCINNLVNESRVSLTEEYANDVLGLNYILKFLKGG